MDTGTRRGPTRPGHVPEQASGLGRTHTEAALPGTGLPGTGRPGPGGHLPEVRARVMAVRWPSAALGSSSMVALAVRSASRSEPRLASRPGCTPGHRRVGTARKHFRDGAFAGRTPGPLTPARAGARAAHFLCGRCPGWRRGARRNGSEAVQFPPGGELLSSHQGKRWKIILKKNSRHDVSQAASDS